MKAQKYDIIVVGVGHAGLEAAFIVAKSNLKVGLFTLSKDNVGSCPCNPSVGGPAKGIVTREIDALGGMQGMAADENRLQIKILNESKGAGVQALRAQIDKIKYHEWFLKKVNGEKNIDLIEKEVISLDIVKNKIKGVICKDNEKISANAVILTTGTYLASKVHIGQESKLSGPIYDKIENKKLSSIWSTYSSNLSLQLKDLGFHIIRLKTGTPPRIYTNSINFKKMIKQPGSKDKISFSHFHPIYTDLKKQAMCWLTYTNKKTHKIIKDNIMLSAMYSGNIKGVGPRYCPSIEDKVVRFADKERHQLFIEPESLSLPTMYIQGLSTSLPQNVQEKMVHSIAGLEKAQFQRYAYAIEYDALDPTELHHTLETKRINGLFCAGQINGTSGYEEAAGQGIVAGINASLFVKKQKPIIFSRDDSYLGVMIDDIVSKGVTDPYRLLTSRAENRLYLRNDNALDRMIKYLKLAKIEGNKTIIKQYENYEKKKNEFLTYLKNTSPQQAIKIVNNNNHSLYDLIKRPEIDLNNKMFDKILKPWGFNDQEIDKIQIEIKYSGYIAHLYKQNQQYKNLESISLKSIKTYSKIKNLSLEAIDKLNKYLPTNLYEASQIPGISLNDITCLKYYLDKK